jgi:hypothetical protein
MLSRRLFCGGALLAPLGLALPPMTAKAQTNDKREDDLATYRELKIRQCEWLKLDIARFQANRRETLGNAPSAMLRSGTV